MNSIHIFFNQLESSTEPTIFVDRVQCFKRVPMFLLAGSYAKCLSPMFTCGTTVELSMPDSGPMVFVSCLTRVTTAKYCGKSDVRIRVIRLLYSSSALSRSVEERI